MIYSFQGPFTYTTEVVEKWDSDAIGVYYCGYKTTTGSLAVLYVGKGTGDGGMRDRLLDHLREDYWPDATHFGFQQTDTTSEAEVHEVGKIRQHNPKYNKVGKQVEGFDSSLSYRR